MSCVTAIVERNKKVQAIVVRTKDVSISVNRSNPILCQIARIRKIQADVQRICIITQYLSVQPSTAWVDWQSDTQVTSNTRWSIT